MLVFLLRELKETDKYGICNIIFRFLLSFSFIYLFVCLLVSNGACSHDVLRLLLDHVDMLITQMSRARELNVATPSILVDAANAESVVGLAWHAIAEDLHRGG